MNEKPPDIPRLAIAYRRLVLWFGAQLFVTLASVVSHSLVQLTLATLQFPPSLPATPMGIALILGNLVIFLAVSYYAYRTAEALGSSAPILWILAMVVPLTSIIALLVLSSRAAKVCQERGIPVGLFGPKLPS